MKNIIYVELGDKAIGEFFCVSELLQTTVPAARETPKAASALDKKPAASGDY